MKDLTSTVTLHTALLDVADTADGRRRAEALLSPTERARRDLLLDEESRREFAFAHALTRLALSRAVPAVAPDAWAFAAGVHGKPRVAGPTGATWPRFNLSHTSGLVACAVSLEHEVGIDVEVTDHPVEIEALAARFFAPAERAALRALPPAARVERYHEYWTLKEAYLKARGLGIGVGPPLHAFWFEDGRIAFAPTVDDQPGAWSFARRRPSARHALALAVHTRGAAAPQVLDEDSLLA